ncbi:arginine biosynthesis protein ArgJ [Dissoconium aciculare CBS 342.82]|uniref:Arginine biosynthesis bifunctional protein ArgJ, mitochondrial n=1 Tax=Dissoconium aciculare CBS 342.82 TaxID=1314786 RepID=A0A6J3M581_9PEZI|nr:arginine biosynthesis protein ArgJ [Dissoconium aciculare CBS 342.82]KAF1823216.1 arginine biosynthesis protein ArgJ [Dissoconium aciculare CBS 342.82]
MLTTFGLRSAGKKILVQTPGRQVRFYSAPGDRAIPAAKQKYVPTEGTYPKGFLVGSAHAGVKASNTKYDDLALVISDRPCVAAALFTKNIFKAAPVQLSMQTLKERQSKGIEAVVVNSGCANAVTGALGLKNAARMAQEIDGLLSKEQSDASSSEEPSRTLVMSTGVIGQNLPIEKMINAFPKLHSSIGDTHQHWLNTAQAICTTDTFPKLISRTFTLPSHPETTYSIAGMTKGAGMIHPNMATLLGIICTDCSIDTESIRPLLRANNIRSFNSISIDGDTSTNDTVALLANGASTPNGVAPLVAPHVTSSDAALQDGLAFHAVLAEFMTDLAKLVVRDGEGATKFVRIRVRASGNIRKSQDVARSIACSSLVKTALYGKDANWGRILCAVGYAQDVMPGNPDTTTKVVVPERTSVSFVPTDGSAELKLLVRGEPQDVDEVRAKEILEMEDLDILVRLNDDPATPDPEAVYYTCDFSHEYVTINGDYRT